MIMEVRGTILMAENGESGSVFLLAMSSQLKS